MNLNDLEQLRDCCRDEAAFERLKQLLSCSNDSPDANQQRFLFQIISKLQNSLDLNTIFTTTVVEVRQLLNADRVGIFRFYPDSQWEEGEFVAEDVLPEFHSALAAKIHDRCFGERYATHYQNGQMQAIADIYQAGLADCHIEILRRFQVWANLIVPLLQGHRLWGLLCVHQCAAPRQWQSDEIEFVRQVATHLSVALQQAELLEQAQQQSIELAQMLRELKKSQTQLIQSEKLSSLGELMAGVTHEINNSANFIYTNLIHASRYANGLLELLALYRQKFPNPGSQLSDRISELDLDFLSKDFPKMFSSMQGEADRIRQVILSMRRFSHVDEAETQIINIHDGIDSALLMLQHRLKLRSNAEILVVKEYGKLPPIECYASQLNQVFTNILSNAIDALEKKEQDDALRSANDASAETQSSSTDPTNVIEPGLQIGRTEVTAPQITICTGFIPDLQTGLSRAIIRIADNGSGMTQMVQQRVFEPFFTTKSVEKGTGLGLYISHQIVVEQHGGVLECYSQLGEGTEFWIEIPTQQAPQQKTVANYTATSCTIEA